MAYMSRTDQHEELNASVQSCQRCGLYKNATQGVVGDGSLTAKILVIGEQPGDKEDLEGKPFVGPAGWLFDRILKEAGIPRSSVYVTNAVKHFKWKRVGKRRIHLKPNAQEIEACNIWLESEVNLIQPRLIVCMGSTALRATLGFSAAIKNYRGRFFESRWHRKTYATVHPSSILRLPEKSDRDRALAEMIDEFKKLKREI